MAWVLINTYYSIIVYISSFLKNCWALFEKEKDPSTYQDVEAGRFEECNLVSNCECGEAWQLLGKFNCLDDALCGQFTEFVPQINVKRYPLIWTVVLLETGKEKRNCIWQNKHLLHLFYSSKPVCLNPEFDTSLWVIILCVTWERQYFLYMASWVYFVTMPVQDKNS